MISQRAQCGPQIRRPFGTQLKAFPRNGMAKRQSRRMQRLPRGHTLDRFRTGTGRASDAAAPASRVDRIADDGMPDVLEMNSDLVRATRVQLEAQQLAGAEPCHHEGIGSRRAAVGHDRHALSIPGMAGQRCLDHSGARVQMTPGERGVGACHPARGNGVAEPSMREVGLGDDHETGGVAIEAMHDARATFRAARQGGAARHERVYQRVVPVPGCGMDDEPGRLVEDGEVIILVHDRQIDGVGPDGAGRLDVGHPHDHGVAMREKP